MNAERTPRAGRVRALVMELEHSLLLATAPASALLRSLPFIVALAIVCLAGRAPAVAAGPDGKHLYMTYCASCHGADGQGAGPAASAFKREPTDLTTLARMCGTFPVAVVMSAIDGRRYVAAHGSREMPVWGERFAGELADEPYPQRTTLFKVREIAEYLATIQQQ